MKGLLKYLSPFAPDQSGAVSVLFEYGGITVVCDAGGCIGNICGFDEPRWFDKKSALFSAGLRDMDAILGRDDRMIDKLKDTASKVDASFAALIGTPVPAVIATDFKALKRMAEKRCAMPVITVECTGTRLYDEGAMEALYALFDRFVCDDVPAEEGSIGVLGLTPLDCSASDVKDQVTGYFEAEGYKKVYCYGMGDGLDAVKKASGVSQIAVVSPSALKTARMLKQRFGISYSCEWPMMSAELKAELDRVSASKILIIHQQCAADTIRNYLAEKSDALIICGSFFMQDEELKNENDVHFNSEREFQDYVEEGGFDLIIADRMLKRPLGSYKGDWLHVPHFAVSGELTDEKRN